MKTDINDETVAELVNQVDELENDFREADDTANQARLQLQRVVYDLCEAGVPQNQIRMRWTRLAPMTIRRMVARERELRRPAPVSDPFATVEETRYENATDF